MNWQLAFSIRNGSEMRNNFESIQISFQIPNDVYVSQTLGWIRKNEFGRYMNVQICIVFTVPRKPKRNIHMAYSLAVVGFFEFQLILVTIYQLFIFNSCLYTTLFRNIRNVFRGKMAQKKLWPQYIWGIQYNTFQLKHSFHSFVIFLFIREMFLVYEKPKPLFMFESK